MLTLQQAQQMVLENARTFGTETILLDDAPGRVLAEPVIADRNYPPFNRATMDGYALSIKDLEKGTRKFYIEEVIYAGHESLKALTEGRCYKIMTGAAVPDSANIIIRREDTSESENEVQINIDTFKPYQFIARSGEDVTSGTTITSEARVCNPAIISALASIGKSEVVVRKLPSVAVFTTGDEIVPVDSQVTPVQIRNSNQHMVRALLKKWQIVPFLVEHIIDDKQLLHEAFLKAIQADIIIISGGVSAGDADFVPGALEKLGVQKLFHKVAIKPGKPLWCGITPAKGMVFALPGNPFSSLVTFTLFVETYLRQCFLGQQQPEVTMPFLGIRSKKSSLDEFFPVQFQHSPMAAAPLSINSSGDILAAFHADGIMHHPASVSQLNRGDLLRYIPL